VDLKKATKLFANKFACGCAASKTAAGNSEVIIQGDVVDEVVDLIQATWPSVRIDRSATEACRATTNLVRRLFGCGTSDGRLPTT